MNESIGYTATLNIVIVFITIIFGFIIMSLNYYRAYKVSNVITDELEKYEGYNDLSSNSISNKLQSLGYSSGRVNCKESIKDKYEGREITCASVEGESAGSKGYCIYMCITSESTYYYKASTNMFMNIPIINNIVNIPIYSTTNELYDFEGRIEEVK